MKDNAPAHNIITTTTKSNDFIVSSKFSLILVLFTAPVTPSIFINLFEISLTDFSSFNFNNTLFT